MKSGEKVMIYEDPITCNKEEGIAKLIELVGEDCGDGLELWVVKFPDDEREFTRTVKVN
jgi:hypothetical protein